MIKKLVKRLRDFSGIACNSKSVRDNFIFVAVDGAREDGHKFIPDAVRAGARLVVVNIDRAVDLPAGVSSVAVKDTRKALAELAAAFYNDPSRKLKAIGVTGTNGKTTVTYLIEAILKAAGRNPAVVGTVNYRFGRSVFASRNTTPGPIELQSLLSKMVTHSVDYAVMEVSSHALDQDRVGGIDFHSAVFTNLTRDHLDYHKNLKNYFAAKSVLFKSLGRCSYAVVNVDDPYGRRLIPLTCCRIITYGIKNKSAVGAKNIKFTISGTEFQLSAPGLKINLKTHLIGRHNVYNILAAASWALGAGIKPDVIKKAVEGFYLVPGRLERLPCKKGFSVFVDYAHTDDALKNVLASLRALTDGRIIVVFGCGGDRDKTKRPKMAAVVSGMSDYAIVTNDNPRFEEPRSIIKDILRGMKNNNYCVIPERSEAIKKSLSVAVAGDVVLVAGKGHEGYQIIKGKSEDFDDREVVRACLKSMN